MTRRPINSAAAPHGRTAAASLEQNDPGATNGPEIGSRATGSAPDRTSQVSDRLAVLAELSVADLRLEWRRLFRADPPGLSRDIMTRAIAYRLQEIAYGGASKVTQRRLMTLAAEFETRGTIAPPSGPEIKPGSRLVREWHGRTHTVCVTGDGFEFQGKSYRSLTKMRSTLREWSGPRADEEVATQRRPTISRPARRCIRRTPMVELRQNSSPARAKVRCAVYTRKSSEEGLEQEFNSLDAQREACEAYITSQKHEGWTVLAALYDDGAYSGGTMERKSPRLWSVRLRSGSVVQHASVATIVSAGRGVYQGTSIPLPLIP